jgi:hypothetical protein
VVGFWRITSGDHGVGVSHQQNPWACGLRSFLFFASLQTKVCVNLK